MSRNLHRQAGLLFILGSLLLFIPYTALVFIFDYPDILRMPVDHILTSFHDGGTLLAVRTGAGEENSRKQR